MKRLALLLLPLLCSCMPAEVIPPSPAIERTANYGTNEGLDGCRVFYLESPRYPNLSVMRCPNSTTSTTYQVGKQSDTTVVIDGVTYAPIPKAGASSATY